jgi:hypothetical protein
LIEVKEQGKIEFSTSVTMMMFFDGLISLIIALILYTLGIIYIDVPTSDE